MLARRRGEAKTMERRDGAKRTRVLVVDDNSVVRRLLVARLQGAGCRVSEAADGLAALEEFRRAPAEVVISDLSMPRLDGLELLAALRAHARPPEVILLTATRASDAEAAMQALRLGAHDYIPKTEAAVEAVVLAVERAAEKWRLREENARLVAELRWMSLTDGLTGVGNRRAFDEALLLEVARARRQRADLALVMLDLDHFKAVNDAIGHPAGDEVLVAFVGRIRSVTRGADPLFRYGGEEFALLLAGAGPDAALAAGDRAVRATAAAPLPAGRGLVPVTCSAGAAVLAPDDGGAGTELVARADAALYAAKRSGRNRVVAIGVVEPTALVSTDIQGRPC
jgi:two-component system chemotaxis family response regulator WspR